MMQTADIAHKETGDPHAIVSALFHDIGHLLVFEEQSQNTYKNYFQKMKTFGIYSHEEIGAMYLKHQGFPPEVYEPVRLHVKAKRFMCTTEPSYFKALSQASQESLGQQGGVMDQEEMLYFKSSPFYHKAIALRLWDDVATTPDDQYQPQLLMSDYLKIIDEIVE